MRAAILNDVGRCAGCKACVMACKEANGLPRTGDPQVLSASAYTVVQSQRGVNVKRQCMHCLEPACVSVCPVGALKKTALGPVVYDADKCMGCRYCMVGCPFGVPTYEWDRPVPKVQKCFMCFATRLSQGQPPACTAACPTGATVFGDRDELIREAERRIATAPSTYVHHIYGLEEAGGTSVLYISPVPLEELGFARTQATAYPRLTWNVLSKLPSVVSVAGAGLFGLWWIIDRRRRLAVERDDEGEQR